MHQNKNIVRDIDSGRVAVFYEGKVFSDCGIFHKTLFRIPAKETLCFTKIKKRR